MGLSPWVRQTVNTLFSVRCHFDCTAVLPFSFAAKCALPGEAEAGCAGAQPAKE
jgi:hypothetical protein